MAFRGRGRGRGRGRAAPSEMRIPKHVPYTDFPEDVTLPALPVIRSLPPELIELIRCEAKFNKFWKGSCYHLQEQVSKTKNQDVEIDSKQKPQAKREALASYLKLIPSNFPAELIQGSRRMQQSNKKLRWDRDSDERAFDMFEKLEEKHKGQDGTTQKKAENEDEEEGQEEAEEESTDDDDYNQNIDFDDDEDDMNMDEEAEEDVYE